MENVRQAKSQNSNNERSVGGNNQQIPTSAIQTAQGSAVIAADLQNSSQLAGGNYADAVSLFSREKQLLSEQDRTFLEIAKILNFTIGDYEWFCKNVPNSAIIQKQQAIPSVEELNIAIKELIERIQFICSSILPLIPLLRGFLQDSSPSFQDTVCEIIIRFLKINPMRKFEVSQLIQDPSKKQELICHIAENDKLFAAANQIEDRAQKDQALYAIAISLNKECLNAAERIQDSTTRDKALNHIALKGSNYTARKSAALQIINSDKRDAALHHIAMHAINDKPPQLLKALELVKSLEICSNKLKQDILLAIVQKGRHSNNKNDILQAYTAYNSLSPELKALALEKDLFAKLSGRLLGLDPLTHYQLIYHCKY